MRDRWDVDPDGWGGGKELERIEGEETVIGIYYVRKKCSIFNKREKRERSYMGLL